MLGQRDERIFRVGSEASRRGAVHSLDLLWPHRRAFTSDRPEQAIDLAYRHTYAVLRHRVVKGPHLEWDTVEMQQGLHTGPPAILARSVPAPGAACNARARPAARACVRENSQRFGRV